MSQPRPPFQRVLLLLIALLTTVVSCIPPFNDFQYADNATFLEEVVAQHEANPAMGWAHVLSGTSPLKPWPKNDKGLVNIQYCWPNLDTKAKLEDTIQGGWEMWHTLLGNAGSGEGHRIGGLSEYMEGPESVFCWLDEDQRTCEFQMACK